METIRFGANYIPSQNWLHSWINWDAAAVREDLTALRALGADHIRANLIWPYFQIDPYIMSPAAMQNLESFVRVCEETEMDFFITLFTGFMSGLCFYPAWQKQLTRGFGEGICGHPKMIGPEEFYIREIAKVVKDSPRFLGFDLGNELSVVLCFDKTAKEYDADAWNTRMLALCEEVAPGKLHNNGVDHMPWFNGTGFSRETLANTGAITPVHTYALFTGALERFGRQSTESVHLAPFMIEMAKAFAEDNDRPYWVQEFGTVTTEVDDEVAEFVRESVKAMYTSGNLWGITWWCSHNIPGEYTSYADIEYNLGLLDTDNQPTRAGLLFRDLVQQYKEAGAVPPARTTAFVMEPYDADGRITPDFVWENGKRYTQLVNEGIYPAIILPHRKDDAAYLKSRGIERVL